jgi:hypothetical protein
VEYPIAQRAMHAPRVPHDVFCDGSRVLVLAVVDVALVGVDVEIGVLGNVVTIKVVEIGVIQPVPPSQSSSALRVTMLPGTRPTTRARHALDSSRRTRATSPQPTLLPGRSRALAVLVN